MYIQYIAYHIEHTFENYYFYVSIFFYYQQLLLYHNSVLYMTYVEFPISGGLMASPNVPFQSCFCTPHSAREAPSLHLYMAHKRNRSSLHPDCRSHCSPHSCCRRRPSLAGRSVRAVPGWYPGSKSISSLFTPYPARVSIFSAKMP